MTKGKSLYDNDTRVPKIGQWIMVWYKIKKYSILCSVSGPCKVEAIFREAGGARSIFIGFYDDEGDWVWMELGGYSGYNEWAELCEEDIRKLEKAKASAVT